MKLCKIRSKKLILYLNEGIVLVTITGINSNMDFYVDSSFGDIWTCRPD